MPKYTKRTGTPGHYRYEYGESRAAVAAPAAGKPAGKITLAQVTSAVSEARKNTVDQGKPVDFSGDASKVKKLLGGLPDGTVLDRFDESGYHSTSAVKKNGQWLSPEVESGKNSFSASELAAVIAGEGSPDGQVWLPKSAGGQTSKSLTASLDDWIQKSEAFLDTLHKGMSNVDDWAMQFGGTGMHVEALQCLKDMMSLRREREKFNASGKSWREEEEMAGSARKSYRDNRSKEREKLNDREDAIRARMVGLEERLLDERIKDAKTMSKSDGGGSVMSDETLEKSYRAIKNAYEEKYGAGAWAKIKVPKQVQESKAKAEKLPFGSKTKLSTEEHYRYTEAKKRLAGSLGMPKTGWGLYGRSIVGALKNKEKKEGKEEETKKSFVADDGKPGKSLKETSTDELKATLAKLKPTDPGAEKRIAALKAELKSRSDGGMEKAKKLPSQSTNLTPEKARQMLHEHSGGHGRSITEQQRKFFGAIGGHLPAPGSKTKKSMESVMTLEDYLEKAEAPDFKKWIMSVYSKKGESTEKSLDAAHDVLIEDFLEKAGGPFVGPRGGKWADAKHTIPWSEKRAQAGKKQEQPKGEADEPFASELELTIVNEGQLHNQMVSIRKNLVNKMANGNYDHAQAAKLWNYAVENGAKLYEKQWGVKADKATRMAVARSLSDQFFEEAMGGEYGHLLNKKNQKALQGLSAEDFKKLATGKSTVAELRAGKGGKMEKSMEGIMSLEDYLEKAGALPSHEPGLGHPKSSAVEGGSADGGNLDGVGKTSGSSDSAPGPGQDSQGQLRGVPTGKKEKLSEDDAEVEGQMKPHKKPIETIKKSTLPADQRDMTAHERAVVVSQLQKSTDVYVGPRAHPLSMDAVHASGDGEASELVKSEGFYHGNSPQEAPGRPILDRGVLCKSINAEGCDEVYSAALTACPACGAGTVGHRSVPGTSVEGPSMTILEKSVGPGSLLRRPRQDPDIKIG